MSAAKQPILTIGHSTHSLDAFLTLLKRHSVTALADVRSAPYSRFNPQFNKDALEESLKAHGISYVFLGRELGARSEDPSCYKNGRVQYVRLASTDLFRSGIERLVRGANQYRVALMCAEKEPLECHRTLLVAPALSKHSIVVQHILADGRVEPHDSALERLLDILGMPREDLFRSREDLIGEALARQEERIAWVNQKLTADTARES